MRPHRTNRVIIDSVQVLKAVGLHGALTAPQGPTDVDEAAAEIARADYARRVRGEELALEQKSMDTDRMLRHLAAGLMPGDV
jgi:hypothetical protein